MSPHQIAPATDHNAAADVVREAAGVWTLVTVYRAGQSADTIANGIRSGRIRAYRPGGSFDAYSAMHEGGTAVWARSLSASWDAEPLPATITVRVPDPGTQPGDGGVCIRPVTISSKCQRCGGPRGPVRPHTVMRDGARLVYDTWTNPCGHQDAYDAVRAEALRTTDGIREPRRKGPQIAGVEGGRYAAAVDFLADVHKEQPCLRARGGAHLLEQAGHTEAAEAVREFIRSSPTRNHTSTLSAARYLMDQDSKAAVSATPGGSR